MSGYTRVALAAQLNELAKHQRRLGTADILGIARREIVNFEAYRRIGHCAGLTAAAIGHTDVAVSDVDARAGVYRLL